jgi:hypothetical protein
VLETAEVDADPDGPGERAAGRAGDRIEIRECLPGLVPDGAGDELSGPIERALSGEEQQIPDLDGLRVRPGRARRLVGGDLAPFRQGAAPTGISARIDGTIDNEMM